MRKLLVGLLCLMMAAGSLSACENGKRGSDSPEQGKVSEAGSEEETKEEGQDSETEEESTGTEDQTDEQETQEQETTEAEENPEENEGDLSEDLTMTVLKDQAGTIDYTSLEELNPEPGSRIAVVIKNKKSAYWSVVKEGMDAAVKDLNEKMGYKGSDKITLSFDGPTDEADVDSQINIIDAVLAENPSVLCLAAIDMESCTAQLETASDNSIPVVILDSGVESELVDAVCATDNYAAGAEAARRLAESIEGKGQIAVLSHVETSETSMKRIAGFTEELQKNYTEIEIVNVSYENEDSSLSEMAEAVLKLYPDLKGYFCTNGEAAEAVLSVTADSDKDIAVVGFDAGKAQQTAVKEGEEVGMIVQNPYGMGYATVIAGVRADPDQYLGNDKFINTGYQWIDSTNLELKQYANYLYE